MQQIVKILVFRFDRRGTQLRCYISAVADAIAFKAAFRAAHKGGSPPARVRARIFMSLLRQANPKANLF
jgi:hypothetical protein